MLKSSFKYIPTHLILGNTLNPRKFFDETALQELAKSIESYGVLQPIVVYESGKSFVLICGERRFRAANLSGLKKMPAIVHEKEPEKEAVLAMALVENLQRKNVDLISEASAIKNLIELYKWNFTKVAKELGTNASFVRNRFLLTKHRDVLESFDKKEISYSEAILISEIDSHGTRLWLIERIINGEIKGQKKLSDAVSRIKKITKFSSESISNKRKIKREKISLLVDDLPMCGASCPHYLRLSWSEKKHFNIDLDNIGWSEFCRQKTGNCYGRKKQARNEILKKFKKFKGSRIIPTVAGESMIWMNYEGKSCRKCSSLLQPQDYALDSSLPICIDKNSKCLIKRTKLLEKKSLIAAKLKKEKLTEIDKRILDQQESSRVEKLDSRLTKNEVCYILTQLLVLLGGESRVNMFLKTNDFYKNAPSGLSDKIRYMHNKLLESFSENSLHEMLLMEVSLSYKFASKKLTPKCFNRSSQKVSKIEL